MDIWYLPRAYSVFNILNSTTQLLCYLEDFYSGDLVFLLTYIYSTI